MCGFWGLGALQGLGLSADSCGGHLYFLSVSNIWDIRGSGFELANECGAFVFVVRI